MDYYPNIVEIKLTVNILNILQIQKLILNAVFKNSKMFYDHISCHPFLSKVLYNKHIHKGTPFEILTEIRLRFISIKHYQSVSQWDFILHKTIQKPQRKTLLSSSNTNNAGITLCMFHANVVKLFQLNRNNVSILDMLWVLFQKTFYENYQFVKVVNTLSVAFLFLQSLNVKNWSTRSSIFQRRKTHPRFCPL